MRKIWGGGGGGGGVGGGVKVGNYRGPWRRGL